jgi:predicted PhzF superfamily epimerase YddE/YHI9
MRLPFTTLDVFTPTRYAGNPLAVIRVPSSMRASLTESQKQAIAREFNLSEVTFLHEPAASSSVADFDIFTPLSRMSFAGHPTIGTAIYVAQHKDHYPGITSLRTVAGLISLDYDESSGKATVGIPHDVHVHQKRIMHPIEKTDSVPIVSIVKGMAFGLCKLPDLEALGKMKGPLIAPETRFERTWLDEGSGWDVGYTGTFYYVDLDRDADGVRVLRTRSIPQHEDPGTGSASAALCCWLALMEKLTGTAKFHLMQGVEMGRRCDIFVDVVMKEDGVGIEDVRLSGQAVEVMEGTLTVW